jgi:para-nitrobenzyl esterase
MPTRRAVLALLTAALLRAPVASAAIAEPVRLDTGLVAGVEGTFPEVRVFKGIPFAAPPVGALRWQPPRAAASWEGVRQADRFGDNCMQRSAAGGAFPPYGGDRSAVTMSEDCLYLNVYTTAANASARQPVMVWIHGGAWTSGAGAIYQGEDLARKGVVVVTLNYRLGVFGFLAHPELSRESEHHASGNYALLDQIAALTWVQKNVAAFGGDPSRVTIFGESAGSWSVNNLTGSPLARGLFHRVIGQSGARFAARVTLRQAESTGVRFAAAVGAVSLAELRAKPAAELIAFRDYDPQSNADGWVLPAVMRTIYERGRQHDVPMLIGSNADEGTIFASDSTTATSFREQVRRGLGADADAYLKLYPFTTDQDARRARADSIRDRSFGWEMRTWARLQARTGTSKVFLYFFNQTPPLAGAAWLGSQHGAEIPYAMNWVNGRHSTVVPWTDADRALAELVSSYWVNFATTGDPNGSGLPTWPPFAATDERALAVGPSVAPIAVPHAPALDLLDAVDARMRTNAE